MHGLYFPNVLLQLLTDLKISCSLIWILGYLKKNTKNPTESIVTHMLVNKIIKKLLNRKISKHSIDLSNRTNCFSHYNHTKKSHITYKPCVKSGFTEGSSFPQGLVEL